MSYTKEQIQALQDFTPASSMTIGEIVTLARLLGFQICRNGQEYDLEWKSNTILTRRNEFGFADFLKGARFMALNHKS